MYNMACPLLKQKVCPATTAGAWRNRLAGRVEWMKTNCWEENQCGREPGGKMADKRGPCPVPLFPLADGFLGGENGGRACMFILERLNAGERKRTCSPSVDACEKCDFHKKLKKKYKKSFAESLFDKFIRNADNR